MDIWEGQIHIDTNSQLRGIKLVEKSSAPSSSSSVSCQSSGSVIPRSSTLTFNRYVNPSLVPLYARVGPNLEFCCTDVASSQWLHTRFLASLLSSGDFDEDDLSVEGSGGPGSSASRSCPMGLLLNVQGGAGNKRTVNGPSSSVLRATELLVYGILCSAGGSRSSNSGDNEGCNNSNKAKRLPSPPLSSSFDETAMPAQQGKGAARELRLYAVPLSSSLIAKAESLPSPPLSPTRSDGEGESTGDGDGDVDEGLGTDTSASYFAEFLPDIRSPSPKRKRMATLFDSADQHYKKMQRRGGEMISKIMAAGTSKAQQQLMPALPPVKKEPPSVDEAMKPSLMDKVGWHQRSRSLSLGGSSLRAAVRSNDLGHELLPPRPGSARGPAPPPRRPVSRKGPNKNSQLQAWPQERVASMTPLDSPDMQSASLDVDLSEQQQRAQAIASENKALITRTILTCMRLYGYHRKATRSHPSASSSSAAAAANRNDSMTTTAQHEELEPSFNDDGITENLGVVSGGQPPSGPDEDEFRTMYYATYKAALFALRRYLRDPVSEGANSKTISCDELPPRLEKEKATTVVDELLKLFCEET